jgi:membrane protein DedA with SNARE-associated domain
MEELFLELIKEYGYIILFIWSIMEGELGLIMAGILSFTGDLFLPYAIVVGALGGFAGDQIYFYLGRLNKSFIHKELKQHRRKFALAHILLKKYGWPIIFIQRYLYGMRTIIPMAIGLTKYNAKKYAFINFLSAIVWATITISFAYVFGEKMISLLKVFSSHKEILIPFGIIIAGSIYFYFHTVTKK